LIWPSIRTSGPATELAVKQFQRSNPEVDGIVGPHPWDALEAATR
jgi:peptidoglycan hydrolase-like protein with peptidoglycan-binding domain